MTELRHLRYFIAVAEELSFTRAAQRLHMAQPPLSTQIKALEEDLKVQLFERDKRRVFLTQAGRHFLERARGILQSMEAARVEARSAASGEIGVIAVGCTSSSMLSALPSLLRAFQLAHPEVHLDMQVLTSVDQLDAVNARQLDLALLRPPGVEIPAGIAVEEWLRAPLVAALPADSPLAGGPLHVRDLRDQPLIMYPRHAGIGLYWKVQELCTKEGFHPLMVKEAQDTSTIVGLVAAGAGAAIVPYDTQCIKLPGVVYQRILDRNAVSSLYLAFRHADESRYLRKLVAALRAHRRESARQAPP